MGQHGIYVQAHNVSIDLNGFVLSGADDVSGHGIYQAPGYNNLTVRNGTVTRWLQESSYGLLLRGANNRIEDLQVVTNYTGILASNNCVFSRCTIAFNTMDGLTSGQRAQLADCVALRNNSDGFSLGKGSTIARCSVLQNGSDGIQLAGDCRATDNHCAGNGARGSGAGLYSQGSHNEIIDNSLIGNPVGLHMDGTNNRAAGNRSQRNGQNYDLRAGNQLDLVLSEVPQDIRWPARLTLAGTLTCASPLTNGIAVSADSVTIDLNGHALIGPGSISRSGIEQVAGYRKLTVRNGTGSHWRGFLQAGIQAEGAHHIVMRNTAGGNLSNYCFAAHCATGITINLSGGGAIGTQNPWVNFVH